MNVLPAVAPPDWCRSSARAKAAALAMPLLLFVGFWHVFGPATAGGTATYVVTAGTSMLPGMKAGGLAVLRERDDYAVGDVVGYRNSFQRSVILHRIIRIDGDRYVFRGDNNDEEDRYQPTRSELIGERWIYRPGLGSTFARIREPRVAGVLLGAVSLVALQPGAAAPTRRRRRHG